MAGRLRARGMEVGVIAEAEVIRKALVAVCADVSDGGPAHFSGSFPHEASSTAHEASPEGTEGASEPVTWPTFVVTPGSTEETAAVMRVAAGHELAVGVRGGGSRLSWGTPPSRCDLVIDMSRMAAVAEHAAGDLVARVQAGARMGDVAEVLARAGQEIALDVPSEATIGGVVASGLPGPRGGRERQPAG